MKTYLYGRMGGTWHALERHDPQYITEMRESVRLTALARKRNPVAPAVTIPRVVDTRPGTGTTLCGIRGPLEGLGVDPDQADALCPACEARKQALG